MPLPYPELLVPGSFARPAGKLAMNALVLMLDWLFLGQPTICRGEFMLELGRPLNARQWRCLEGMRPSVDRWNAVETVGPTEMGRAASKFESLEGLLSKVRAGLERVGFSEAASLGSVRLKLEQPCHALPVDCDRIRFVGEPSFDPRPFLDNGSRRIYEHPLEFRKEIPAEAKVPRTVVRTVPGKRLGLLQALDRCKRLKLVPVSDMRTPHRNGLFCVPKDENRDRLVLDARVANRWIQSLGSLEQLQYMYIPPTHDLAIYLEDLREFYHSFEIGEERCHRNALAMWLSSSEARALSACCRSSSRGPFVPCLNTLAMGDSHAVGFGQTAHLAVLLRFSQLKLKNFISLRGRPPRSPSLVAGLLIDDFLVLDFIAKGASAAESLGATIVDEVRAGYETARLPRHTGKAVHGASQGEFWGGLLDWCFGGS